MYLMPKSFFNDDYFSDTFSNQAKMLADIYEDEQFYYIDLDIPGFKKEDIQIELNDNYLTVIASNEEIDEKEYIRRERFKKNYSRSFYVGNIIEEDINAEFKDGTLKIKILKKEKIETRKSIDIK